MPQLPPRIKPAQVESAIADLQIKEIPVTYGAIAKVLGCNIQAISKEPELRAIVDAHRTKPGKIYQRAALDSTPGHRHEPPIRSWVDPSFATWTPEYGEKFKQRLK